jgi:hypothetical protein
MLFIGKLRHYWSLTKPSQSGLAARHRAGRLYERARAVITSSTLLQLSVSLFLAIAGSTILNMWWDRDIDAKMGRTQKRVTSKGLVAGKEVLLVGLWFRSSVSVGLGNGPALWLVVFAGCSSMWLCIACGSNAAPHGASSGAAFRARCPSWRGARSDSAQLTGSASCWRLASCSGFPPTRSPSA